MTYCVVLIDAFSGYPLKVVARGKTQNDATAIAAEIEESGRSEKCRVYKEQ